ncbi:ADP-ribosylglycohydrolase family protein [Sorangium sp. So ce406]|uniref:ADP-ribosylglycohydrolase family protein n=1 Tax=Sorangium sp. So ce406 TaxID=3133311 RepID=UPI003F5C18B6
MPSAPSGARSARATPGQHDPHWLETGRISGVGPATLKAIRDLAAGAHWALAGARGEFASGSGAAMRAAPLSFFFDPSVEEGRRAIRDVARITHHSDEAYAGAPAVVVALRHCASNGDCSAGSHLRGPELKPVLNP